jgi:hypothetical protein
MGRNAAGRASVGVQWVFEDNTLVIALALALRLDAIATGRALLAAFYPPSSAS